MASKTPSDAGIRIELSDATARYLIDRGGRLIRSAVLWIAGAVVAIVVAWSSTHSAGAADSTETGQGGVLENDRNARQRAGE